MGTDIHLQAEIRTNGAWQRLPNPNGRSRLFSDRNYFLFGILAGVRGIRENGVISEPRGFPDDLSFIPDGEYDSPDYVDLGEHSYSWLTLRELYAWDWGQTVMQRKTVSVVGYHQWKLYGHEDEDPPEEYVPQYATGKQVDHFAMDVILSHFEGPSFWTEVKKRTEWTEVEYAYTHAQLAGKFYSRTMPLLFHACEGRLDDCRIVFGFDS